MCACVCEFVCCVCVRACVRVCKCVCLPQIACEKAQLMRRQEEEEEVETSATLRVCVHIDMQHDL